MTRSLALDSKLVRRTPPEIQSDDSTVTDWGSGMYFVDAANGTECEPPHLLEHSVRRELMKQPGLSFSSLVVRRLPNGVCLEGVVESKSTPSDIARIVNAVDGVDRVVNRLVVRQPQSH